MMWSMVLVETMRVKEGRASTEERKGVTSETLDVPIAMRNPREMETRKNIFISTNNSRSSVLFFRPLRKFCLLVTNATGISHRILNAEDFMCARDSYKGPWSVVENLPKKASRKK